MYLCYFLFDLWCIEQTGTFSWYQSASSCTCKIRLYYRLTLWCRLQIRGIQHTLATSPVYCHSGSSHQQHSDVWGNKDKPLCQLQHSDFERNVELFHFWWEHVCSVWTCWNRLLVMIETLNTSPGHPPTTARFRLRRTHTQAIQIK